mmetsp:Transcript_105512/g.128793  ORF Transcript_105512/g.128793 Transcript_105512/m.128793 type:complete len:325 (-) Transcript_105512:52-1026(-)
MGSSNSNQQKSNESKESAYNKSKLLSSFGDTNDKFKKKVESMALKGDIPLTLQDHSYKLYRWKKNNFDHESIVVVPVSKSNSSDDKKYGSFTIELVVNVASKKVYLTSNYITPIKSAEYIKAAKWFEYNTAELLIKFDAALQDLVDVTGLMRKMRPRSGIAKDIDIVIKTHSDNFLDLAIKLIQHHGKYSSYCNNCQTFVNGYMALVRNHFVYKNENTIQRSNGTDAERTAIVVGLIFAYIPGLVAVGVNHSLVKSNDNTYNQLSESCNKLLPTQQAKVDKLTKEYKLSEQKAIDLLWKSLWDLDNAILIIKDGKKDINQLINK